MNKLRKIQILGGVSAASLIAMPLVIAESYWDSLYEGTRHNNAFTLAFVVLIISVSWLLVAYARYETPEGDRTSWEDVAWVAIIALGAMAVCVIILLAGIPVFTVMTRPLLAALTPVALSLLMWTALAAVLNKVATTRDPAEVSEPAKKTGTPTPVRRQVNSDSEQTAIHQSDNRRSVIVVSSIAGVLVAVALVFVVDQWMRSQELNSMLDTVEQTESVMVTNIREHREANDSFEKWEMTSREFAESRYVEAIQQAGENLAVELKILNSTWEEINVLPWHSDLARFRNDYTDHLNAWIASGEFYEIASSFSTIVGPDPNRSDISATFTIATDSARNLPIPIFAPDAAQRIEAIFQD